MPLYRRKDSPYWWVRIVLNGRTIQASSGTADRRQAQEIHDKMKAQMWDLPRPSLRPRHTWQEAVVRYIDESKQNRTLDDAKAHLRWIDRHLRVQFLDQITRDVVDALRSRREADGVAPATVNRLLEIIRTILRRAALEWDWLDKAPFIRLVKVPRSKERFLTREEAIALMRELPLHLADVAGFALETGMRMREILRLQWRHVDLDQRRTYVASDHAKNGFARSIPLSEFAARIIERQRGKNLEHVFTYNGEATDQANGHAWRKALVRAGIKDFRFHDLRHTWATWQAQSGTPLLILQQLGGWRTIQMVQRYAHHQPGHLQPYAERMSSERGLGAILSGELRSSYADSSTPL